MAVKGAERVVARIQQAAKDMRAETERAMVRASVVVQQALRLEMTAPETRDAFWGKVGSKTLGLSVRSGKTRSSLTPGTRVYRVGDKVVAAIGSAERHLKLHEDGATIYGTSPKGYLRIPTAAAQTSAGVDRWAGRSIKDIPGAFLFKSKAGNLWAAVRRGKSAALTLLYLLKRSAKLKPRRIFARTRDSVRPKVMELTRDRVTAVVRKANG